MVCYIAQQLSAFPTRYQEDAIHNRIERGARFPTGGIMNPQTEAIYSEFPFLEKHFPEKANVTKARVSRITDEFLNQNSAYIISRQSGYGPWAIPYGEILLFDENSKLLAQVGVKKIQKRFLFWKFSQRETFIESVGQALLRLDHGASVHYAVWLKNDGELVVYKPPNDFTIQGWYKEQIRHSEQSVHDSVYAIDSRTDC
jgi:hypothetical protein